MRGGGGRHELGRRGRGPPAGCAGRSGTVAPPPAAAALVLVTGSPAGAQALSSVVASDAASTGLSGLERTPRPGAELALGGGVDLETVFGMSVTSSAPVFDDGSGGEERLLLTADRAHPAPIGWRTTTRNDGSQAGAFKVAAICVPEPGSAALSGRARSARSASSPPRAPAGGAHREEEIHVLLEAGRARGGPRAQPAPRPRSAALPGRAGHQRVEAGRGDTPCSGRKARPRSRRRAGRRRSARRRGRAERTPRVPAGGSRGEAR